MLILYWNPFICKLKSYKLRQHPCLFMALFLINVDRMCVPLYDFNHINLQNRQNYITIVYFRLIHRYNIFTLTSKTLHIYTRDISEMKKFSIYITSMYHVLNVNPLLNILSQYSIRGHRIGVLIGNGSNWRAVISYDALLFKEGETARKNIYQEEHK